MHSVIVEASDHQAVVVASGELDAYVAPDLIAAFEDAGGAARLVVDLTAVSFMDSTALGLLVRVARERDAQGSAVRIVLPRGTARRIFEITALDRALPIASDRAAALAQLGVPPTGA